MAVYGNQNYTSFRAVNMKDAIVRFEAGVSGQESTLSVRSTTYHDSAYAWTLPAKSGILPISGTFSVDLPAMSAATQFYSTVVTVSGIRSEDALTVTLQGASTSSARAVQRAVPGNGQITLYVYNMGVAANFVTYTFAYTASR